MTESEARWLAQAQQGDPQAFARLVERYPQPSAVVDESASALPESVNSDQ